VEGRDVLGARGALLELRPAELRIAAGLAVLRIIVFLLGNAIAQGRAGAVEALDQCLFGRLRQIAAGKGRAVDIEPLAQLLIVQTVGRRVVAEQADGALFGGLVDGALQGAPLALALLHTAALLVLARQGKAVLAGQWKVALSG
jgi:hypothetical protein